MIFSLNKVKGGPAMNKDSWIALIIASIITIVAATPLYYSRDYSRGAKGKISEGSDTKTTKPMIRIYHISGITSYGLIIPTKTTHY